MLYLCAIVFGLIELLITPFAIGFVRVGLDDVGVSLVNVSQAFYFDFLGCPNEV